MAQEASSARKTANETMENVAGQQLDFAGAISGIMMYVQATNVAKVGYGTFP